MAKKRVIIVGSGPTGLFTALELSKNSDLEILILEKGPFREVRTEDNLISGIGGAGAFSDGKLSLPNSDYPRSLNVGGQLVSVVGEKEFLKLVRQVDQTYTRFGGRPDNFGNNGAKIQELMDKAEVFGLRVIPTKVRHFGSDLAPEIIKNIVAELQERGVQIYSESPVKRIRKEGKRFLVKIAGENSGLFESSYLVAAPGREGADWLSGQARKLGAEIQPRQTSVDIGVRVEVKAHILKPITDYLYDPKIEYFPKPFEDRVRTFCVCPRGEVLIEKYRGLLTTVNGHSLFEKSLSENTNFALLVSVNFTEPFKEPIKFAQSISENANRLAGEGRVLVQRLGDLRNGRRSKSEKITQWLVKPTLKEATPGDISFVIPYRHLTGILKMLEVLDKIAPGVNGENTLLYAAEVKFYSSRIKTSKELEARENFFVGGDGAGITRGLVQSSASGIIIARAIIKRI